MTTAYNGRRMAVGTYPRFSGKLARVTGESEHLELAFTAETPEELLANLAAAGVAAATRLATNNETILAAGATFEERQRQVYDAAVHALRREVETMLHARREEHEPPPDDDEDEPQEPVGPPAPGDAPAEEDEPPDADATPRALHPPTDP